MSGLPSSLTVLRPIGFGTITGPDGTDVSAIPNILSPSASLSPSVTIDIPVGGVVDDDGTLSSSPPHSPPRPLASPPNAIESSTNSHKSPHKQQTSTTTNTNKIKSPKYARSPKNMPPPGYNTDKATLEAEARDKCVAEIEIGIGAIGSDDEDDVIGFSAEELSGHPSIPTVPYVPVVASSIRRHTLEDEKEGSPQPTPATNTRTILLAEQLTNLPTDSTMPPMAKMKLQTFDELKAQLRWKTYGLWILTACVFIMGVTCIVIGARALPTVFLHLGFPYVIIVTGVFMILLSPFQYLSTRHYKIDEFRVSYVVSSIFFLLNLIVGILVATKHREKSVATEVLSHWNFDTTVDGSSSGKYSQARQEEFGTYENLIQRAQDNLYDMAIVTILSSAIFLGHILLTVHMTHVMTKFFTLTQLQTQSKSSSAAANARRLQEIDAYKSALASDPSSALSFDLEEERIPEAVKFKIAVQGKKYEEERQKERQRLKAKQKKQQHKSQASLPASKANTPKTTTRGLETGKQPPPPDPKKSTKKSSSTKDLHKKKSDDASRKKKSHKDDTEKDRHRRSKRALQSGGSTPADGFSPNQSPNLASGGRTIELEAKTNEGESTSIQMGRIDVQPRAEDAQ